MAFTAAIEVDETSLEGTKKAVNSPYTVWLPGNGEVEPSSLEEEWGNSESLLSQEHQEVHDSDGADQKQEKYEQQHKKEREEEHDKKDVEQHRKHENERDEKEDLGKNQEIKKQMKLRPKVKLTP